MDEDIDQQIQRRKGAAYQVAALDDYVFYASVERQLALLRLAVTMSARLYKNTGDDGAWNALFEALSDTGMLDTEPAS
jgi:hypothetical protein